ncbi:contact-dependent growth inhibition system immunity protein [Noviherbaspirillum massiliense]|uniref:contact-dependent growth inhibition system immunity protein n=1 Tax=Noviherbaspirillum massiliense TaxID=1465823 RepID=UPI0011DE5579|nr:contact-dependent growth inhibition system immunity protein [Noviherbaspirillum massiliense]
MRKTIEQLEGAVWREPAHGSHLAATCHQLRKKPINQFSVEDLRLMIGQDIGSEYLVPVAMEVLERDLLAEGDYYPGDLLKSLITLPKQYWETHSKQLRQARDVASRAFTRLEEAAQLDARPSNRDLMAAIEKFLNEPPL